MKARNHLLDILRGAAVVLMLIFHFTYDLRNFGFIDLSFQKGFWYGLPRFIVFLFLWCVGASLVMVHRQKINWKAFALRTGKLCLIALIISVVTYFSHPDVWIYLGTIHCIALVSIMAIPFLLWPKLQLPGMLIIMFLQYVAGYDIAWVGTLFPRYSMDFIPPYPWLWVTLLGMLTGPWVLKQAWAQRPCAPLEFLGRHALKIYLIHQVLFFGLLSLAKSIYS